MKRAILVEFERLTEYLPRVEATLAADYAAARKRSAPPFRGYLDRSREFTLRGGKRFRALLVLAGYHLASRKDPAAAVPAAAALEHFQSWMLVHDDIIDHSETRRGGPTLHRWFAEEHRRIVGQGEPEAYGVGMGITLGDLEESFTVEALLSVRAPAPRVLAALTEYVRMTRLTAYGQLLDVRNGAVDLGQVTEADVLLVHRLKSAVYTVSAPLRIGAILGGAKPALLDDLEGFGLAAGVAFQLRDDVLGTGFDAVASGKSANDLVEGKRTLLVVRAWARGTEEQRAALRAVLGHSNATAPELELARDAIRSSGSLEYSERRISALTAEAMRTVRRSHSLTTSGRSLLGEVAEKLVRRRA
ncbi:MAG: polyprenyl synthetase family protein [Thermoplasmata archaeon]|nr:polyprenyl synthetase family protein [Thermoplasmata archaeon]